MYIFFFLHATGLTNKFLKYFRHDIAVIYILKML